MISTTIINGAGAEYIIRNVEDVESSIRLAEDIAMGHEQVSDEDLENPEVMCSSGVFQVMVCDDDACLDACNDYGIIYVTDFYYAD